MDSAAFLRLVGEGKIEAVRAAVAAQPELVNVIGPHPFWGGRPQPLHVAVETNRPEMVHLLLDAGADVNGTNHEYEHWTPLMLAIHDAERTALKDELVLHGARIGLMEALMLGDDAKTEDLLRAGPSAVPAYAPNGGSILNFARTPFAIDRLLELGAPTDVKDRWGTTPIEAMSRLGKRGRDLVRHMIARGIPAAPEEYARLGDQEVLAKLIASDPAVAKHDAVMMGAVDFGHGALVEWLLVQGANPNAWTATGSHTALHSAAWNGDLAMAKLLIAAGADPCLRDKEHNGTPYGWADTAVAVTNNPDCKAVAEYLRSVTPREPGDPEGP